MAGIALFGLGLYIVIHKGKHNMQSATILNNFVKLLPIDRDTKDMITPFIANHTNEKAIERMQNSGTKNKRSVSETKKKICGFYAKLEMRRMSKTITRLV